MRLVLGTLYPSGLHTHTHTRSLQTNVPMQESRHANKQSFPGGWTVSQLNVTLADASSLCLAPLILVCLPPPPDPTNTEQAPNQFKMSH